MARSPRLACPICRGVLHRADLREGGNRCRRCDGWFEAALFAPPRVRQAHVGGMGESGPQAGAPCAAHPGNLAVGECERCGGFLCGLCRIELDGNVLCPACFNRLDGEGELEGTRHSFRDYRSLTVTAIALGMLIWPVMALTGLAALIGCVLWSRQVSRQPVLRELWGRTGTAICWFLALAQFGGGLVLLVFFLRLMADGMR